MENYMNNDNNTNNMTTSQEARKRPLSKRIGACILSGTIIGACAGLAFTGTSYAFHKTPSTSSTQLNTTASLTTSNSTIKPTNTMVSNSGSTKSISDIVNSCMPSIVAITNISVTDVRTFWGNMQQENTSCGSGVIVGKTDAELLMVTNYHVIEGNKNLTVVFSYDESNEEPNAVNAYVKGYDEDRDLAVIAIQTKDLTDDIMKQISTATIGSSKNLNLGEQVVAIGNALGYGQSVTTGIVSALNRTISSTESSNNDANTFIQTDAAINPGNSGGALFNMSGELIGINTAKIASDQVEGMGYAIPISDVYDLIEELMNSTTRTTVIDSEKRGYLGISGTDVTSSASSSYGLPVGVYVSSVSEGSAAEKAGITQGNIITKFDGKSVSSISKLQDLLKYYSAGEKIKLTVQVAQGSSYIEKEITITLSSAKEAGINTQESSQNSSNSNNDFSENQFPFGDNFNGEYNYFR